MTTYTSQERFRTEKGVFDDFTERNLFELQSRKFFDEIIGPVKIGKESNVFLAAKGKKKIIIKIYRLQNCDFKRMYDYIRKDPRYEYMKKQRREIIFAWVQREYKNILRAEKEGVTVPKPITVRSNILLEEMIGDKEPALQLKNCLPQNPQEFFDKIIVEMKKLYKAGLIHGDLSPFNILNYDDRPYFIDFSQTTLTKTPNWDELLHRDIKNILYFFKKLGVHGDEEKIFAEIVSAGKKE